jgi:hypothetical protein
MRNQRVGHGPRADAGGQLGVERWPALGAMVYSIELA